MTVATKVISVLYPVVGGAGAALTTRAALQAGRRFVVGKSRTPSSRGSGGTALVWTALSWAVSAGAGIYAGKKLLRPVRDGSAVPIEPAESQSQPAQSQPAQSQPAQS